MPDGTTSVDVLAGEKSDSKTTTGGTECFRIWTSTELKLLPPNQVIVGVRVWIVPVGDVGVGGTTSPTGKADEHGNAALPLVLSVKTTAGDSPASAAGGLAKFRLFVSAVKLSSTQKGAPLLAPSTAVLTTIVAPLLNTAFEPLPSPNTLNSAVVHFGARSRTLSRIETT